MNLVGGVGVPDNQLPILRGGNQVPAVGRPVHRVDLGQVALERSLRLHELVLGDGLVSLLGNSAHWKISKG